MIWGQDRRVGPNSEVAASLDGGRVRLKGLGVRGQGQVGEPGGWAWSEKKEAGDSGRCGQTGVDIVVIETCFQWGVFRTKRSGVSHSQVATVSLDALSGAEALSVAGVAHSGMAITLAG